MNKFITGFVVVLIATSGFLYAVPNAGQSQTVEDPDTAQAPDPANNSSSNPAPNSISRDVYRVAATNESAINRSALQEHGDVGTQAGSAIELTTTRTGAAAVSDFPWVEDVRPTAEAVPGNGAGGGTVSSLGVESLHKRGITGEDVSVGVLALGIDTSAPSISDNVVSVRRFDSGSHRSHGTRVAKTVLKTAPDAQLHIAVAGTGVDDEAAISHFQEKDVDIIVHSAGNLYIDDDGEHYLTDDIRAATNDGILFVNSAGNSALSHWEGDFTDADTDGFHEFAPQDERNCITSCYSTYQGQLSISLHWPQEGDGSEYRVRLYNSERDEYVASSRDRYRGGERLSRSGDTQPLEIVIEHTAGPANDELELTISTSGSHELERYVSRSSISAPADVPSAVAVGAYRRYNEQITDYSSRGPTDDGRRGLTVAGYTHIGLSGPRYGGSFSGTSAAAPHVAGVGALVEDATSEDLTAEELRTRLTRHADDVGRPGPDLASGAGVVNATAAVPDRSRSGGQETQVDIVADTSDVDVAPGETVTLSYSLRNSAGGSTSILVEYPGLPDNISLREVDGDVAQNLSGSTPPGLITTAIPAESNTTVTARFGVSEDAATGSYPINAKATIDTQDRTTNVTTTTNVSVTEQDSLVARFGGSDGELGNLDVLRAVNAANNDQEIGGQPVTNLDVLQLVNRVT
ncbi:S8 family serine peptidase [Haloplanus ruber]|uniref:S8 family serine peptidase n=1 Tax=Haloplanus ruber TaxID=869892 RepID=A0ABD6D098_9EURY|nr:S8 family serine peptidase [Haloplanus ruber]